jgi:hypothetical protein
MKRWLAHAPVQVRVESKILFESLVYFAALRHRDLYPSIGRNEASEVGGLPFVISHTMPW